MQDQPSACPSWLELPPATLTSSLGKHLPSTPGCQPPVEMQGTHNLVEDDVSGVDTWQKRTDSHWSSASSWPHTLQASGFPTVKWAARGEGKVLNLRAAVPWVLSPCVPALLPSRALLWLFCF